MDPTVDCLNLIYACLRIFLSHFQDIVFEGFEVISSVVADVDEWDTTENSDAVDIESMNISPWAGSDRDYSYEEVTTLPGQQWPFYYQTMYFILLIY